MIELEISQEDIDRAMAETKPGGDICSTCLMAQSISRQLNEKYTVGLATVYNNDGETKYILDDRGIILRRKFDSGRPILAGEKYGIFRE